MDSILRGNWISRWLNFQVRVRIGDPGLLVMQTVQFELVTDWMFDAYRDGTGRWIAIHARFDMKFSRLSLGYRSGRDEYLSSRLPCGNQ